jgi:hypothetical protein
MWLLDWLKGYKTHNINPPVRIRFPAIPGRSRLEGKMDYNCPDCDSGETYGFTCLDTQAWIIRCNDCKFEVRHQLFESAEKAWKEYESL